MAKKRIRVSGFVNDLDEECVNEWIPQVADHDYLAVGFLHDRFEQPEQRESLPLPNPDWCAPRKHIRAR